MNHIVSISGGIASAVAADRVLQRFDNVELWFTDTSWEDEDLYRFLDDLEAYWGQSIIRYQDGRTPLGVGEDENFIPTHRRAICSRILKQEPFRKLIIEHVKPVTIHLGLDWKELHRMEAPKKHYESIDSVSVDYPLMWKPYCWDLFAEVRSWGIVTPRLYEMGFPHNNCGGRCIRQGIREWKRLMHHFPQRFAEVRDWETMMRSKGPPLNQYAIAKDQSNKKVTPLTLTEIELREEPDKGEPSQEDMFACFCDY